MRDLTLSEVNLVSGGDVSTGSRGWSSESANDIGGTSYGVDVNGNGTTDYWDHYDANGDYVGPSTNNEFTQFTNNGGVLVFDQPHQTGAYFFSLGGAMFGIGLNFTITDSGNIFASVGPQFPFSGVNHSSGWATDENGYFKGYGVEGVLPGGVGGGVTYNRETGAWAENWAIMVGSPGVSATYGTHLVDTNALWNAAVNAATNAVETMSSGFVNNYYPPSVTGYEGHQY